MCGIAGWAGEALAPPQEAMGRLLGALVHRGPDSEGREVGPGWALGARRLAVIDLVTGDQPVRNEAAQVHAVLNGEIYNYRELREHLLQRGHRLRSAGDTEVLVHLWEDEGPAMLRRLRGMFALAIADEQRRTVFLARDRVGKKPLYWTRHGGTVVFASELKALRAALGDRPALDRDALQAFLMFGFVPEGQCIYQGYAKLPPAHWLSVDLASGEITTERYWRLDLSPDAGLSFGAACRTVAESLDEATELRLRADVPLAVFLSGGLDSGVVTALAARRQVSLRALHVAFTDDATGERELVRATAARTGASLREVAVDAAAGLRLLPALAEIFDEPLADPSCVPTYLVAKAARGEATVVLNGDGGDEALAGYRRFLAQRLSGLPGVRLCGRWAGKLASLLLPLAGRPGEWGRRLGDGLAAADPYLAWGPVKLSTAEAAALTGGAIGAPWPYLALLERHAALDPVNLMRALELEFFLAGDLLVKMDRATMACSLEARSPLLDHVLLERTAAFPPRVLLRGWRTKAVLRAAARELLPAEVLGAPKRGFEVPLAGWLGGPWAAEVRELLADPGSAIRQVLEPSRLEPWLEWQRRPDRQRAARAVYTLLTLEHWLRRWR